MSRDGLIARVIRGSSGRVRGWRSGWITRIGFNTLESSGERDLLRIKQRLNGGEAVLSRFDHLKGIGQVQAIHHQQHIARNKAKFRSRRTRGNLSDNVLFLSGAKYDTR